jgi:hypothetical protein
MDCGAIWIGNTHVFCQLEQGHHGEHFSKVRIEYENGIDGFAAVTWIGHENLESQKSRILGVDNAQQEE